MWYIITSPRNSFRPKMSLGEEWIINIQRRKAEENRNVGLDGNWWDTMEHLTMINENALPSDGDDDSKDDNNGSQLQRQPPVPHWQPHCPLPDDFQRHHKLKETFYHQYTATHLFNYLKLWDEGNVIWHRYHYCTFGQREHVNKNSDLVYKSPEAFRQKLETSCASSLESFSCLPARYIFIIFMFWFVKFVKL